MLIVPVLVYVPVLGPGSSVPVSADVVSVPAGDGSGAERVFRPRGETGAGLGTMGCSVLKKRSTSASALRFAAVSPYFLASRAGSFRNARGTGASLARAFTRAATFSSGTLPPCQLSIRRPGTPAPTLRSPRARQSACGCTPSFPGGRAPDGPACAAFR